MKIKPVRRYKGFIPATFAMLGGIVSSCQKQQLVGSVPNPSPKETENQYVDKAPSGTDESKQEEEPSEEEFPQILAGDVPVENCGLDDNQ